MARESIVSWLGSCLPVSQFLTVWAVTFSSSATVCWVSWAVSRAVRSVLPRVLRAACLALCATILLRVSIAELFAVLKSLRGVGGKTCSRGVVIVRIIPAGGEQGFGGKRKGRLGARFMRRWYEAVRSWCRSVRGGDSTRVVLAGYGSCASVIVACGDCVVTSGRRFVTERG